MTPTVVQISGMRTRRTCTLLLVGLAFALMGKGRWAPASGNPARVNAKAASGFATVSGAVTSVPTSESGRWTPLTGLGGGLVTTMLANGTDLFVGMDTGLDRTRTAGIFRSTDQGASWMPVNAGLRDRRIFGLGASGPNLLAGTYNDGIFLSTDRGRNWTPVSPHRAVTSFVTIGSRLLAAGLFRESVAISTDQGRSWTESDSILPASHALVASGTNVFAATARDAVYRSTDEGHSWQPVHTGFNTSTSRYAYSLAVIGTKVLAGTGSGLFATTNQGENWTPANQGLPRADSVVLSLLVSGAKLFAATDGGVFVSTDQGQSWSAAGAGLPQPFYYAAIGYAPLALSGTNLFAGHFGAGVFRSTDEGRTWGPANAGLNQAPVNSLVASEANLFALMSLNPVWRSPDQGRSWSHVDLPGAMFVNAMVANGTSLLAGASNGVHRSIDQGRSWTAANTGFPSQMNVAALAVSGARLLAGTNRGVFVSTDGGQNWAASNNGLTNLVVRKLAASGMLVAAEVARPNFGSDIFVSIDSGQNWMPSMGLPTSFEPDPLWVDGMNLFGVFNGRLHRSTDRGRSWRASRVGITGNVYSLAGGGANLFAGGAGGVYHSSDGGQSWTANNEGLPQGVGVNSLLVSGASIFAGLDGGGIYAGSGFMPSFVTVSAASYRGAPFEVAVESIVAGFGTSLAASAQSAAGQPLPTELAGTRVTIKDSAGTERLAPLFFVSPNQINYQIAPGTTAGEALVTVQAAGARVVTGAARVATVAPGLFTANATGEGVAAAVALRVKADGATSYEPVALFDAPRNQFVTFPIDLGPDVGAASDQVFLILFGTGIRHRGSLSAVAASIGGLDAQALYAGPQGTMAGLDQVNLRLPRQLAGRGEVSVSLSLEGRASNTVRISIR